MEDIPTERAGAVVACVAPLFSLRPDIHHWLYYYTGLGVSRFHMYVPTLHAHEQVRPRLFLYHLLISKPPSCSKDKIINPDIKHPYPKTLRNDVAHCAPFFLPKIGFVMSGVLKKKAKIKLKLLEQVHYDEPHEVWMTVKGFNFRLGETHTDPFHPFDHPLISWHHYSPSNRENYFGQVTYLPFS